MTRAHHILHAHPSATANASLLLDCAEACFDCAQSCTACADACLAGDDVQLMVSCIRVCLDCADQCTAAGRVLSRQTELEETLARRVVDACSEACRICAELCERYADQHEHCGVCAEACLECEDSCSAVAAVLWRRAASR
jgi:hypothetical protein